MLTLNDGKLLLSQVKMGLCATSVAWFPLGSCKHGYIISNVDNSWVRAPYTPMSKDKTENQLSHQTCRESCSGFWSISGTTGIIYQWQIQFPFYLMRYRIRQMRIWTGTQ